MGDLTAVGDPDDPSEAFGMHAFALVSGSGSDDNADFQIRGSRLEVRQGVVIDRRVKPAYAVRVRATDGDNAVEQSFTINVNPVLSLTISPSSISELGGVATGTITRQLDLTSDVTVLLSSSDTSEATVPASITIPANQASATFSVVAQDDNLLDGVQTVTITATIAGFRSESDTVVVTDFEQLLVSITDGAISENGGTTTATVTRGNADNSQPLTVNLSSDDASEATVPARR